jgi:hypothetical protein
VPVAETPEPLKEKLNVSAQAGFAAAATDATNTTRKNFRSIVMVRVLEVEVVARTPAIRLPDV